MDDLVSAWRERDLLEAEMSHRIKNVLAVVQGVARQTFKPPTPVSDALSTYSRRLAAIGDAFMVLGREQSAAVLSGLVSAAVAPFQDPDRPQITMSGPDLQVGAKPALALSIALHELCTNAVKYGSLSRSEGRVAISWHIADHQLRFLWEELNGPDVVPPRTKGFGSRMMEKALSAQIGGTVTVDYAPSGLRYSFTAPVALLEASTIIRDETHSNASHLADPSSQGDTKVPTGTSAAPLG